MGKGDATFRGRETWCSLYIITKDNIDDPHSSIRMTFEQPWNLEAFCFSGSLSGGQKRSGGGYVCTLLRELTDEG